MAPYSVTSLQLASLPTPFRVPPYEKRVAFALVSCRGATDLCRVGFDRRETVGSGVDMSIDDKPLKDDLGEQVRSEWACISPANRT